MADPEAFPGEIVLRGVVAGRNEAAGAFALVDLREYERCGAEACADEIVPVRYAGALPDVGRTVRVRGRVRRSDEGMVFAADEVEVIP
jgi:hypothetical protein